MHNASYIFACELFIKKNQIFLSDSCTFYNDGVETILIQHVFIGWDTVSIFWSSLNMHIYQTTSKRLGFNIINISLGQLPLYKGNETINVLILYTNISFSFFFFFGQKETFQDCWNYYLFIQ